MPGATVTVIGLDDGTKTINAAPATTSDKGVAVFDGLAPGHYSVQARFSGFEDDVLKDVPLRSGENKHIVALGLKVMQDTVSDVQNAQRAAADPRGNPFRTVLTPADIQALSDDPAEMAHLSPAAVRNAIRLLDGDMLETGRRVISKS